jgi:hypothetical protein
MVASEKTVVPDADCCSTCEGTGLIRYWSEVAYFEDLRTCPRCDEGRRIDSKIADILRRAQLEEQLSRR